MSYAPSVKTFSLIAAVAVLGAGCRVVPVFSLKGKKGRTCASDFLDYTGGITHHVLNGSGDGTFVYDPPQSHIDGIDGLYDLKTGDFWWDVTYLDWFKTKDEFRDGTGTIWKDGDMDVGYRLDSLRADGSVRQYELRTVRNPPEALLAEECARGYTVAERLRRALPRVVGTVTVESLGDARRVQLVLENLGALPTCSLQRGEDVGAAPAVRAELELAPGMTLVDGPAERALSHLDGWMRHGFDRNPFYPSLPDRGHRAVATWTVRGEGPLQVRWQAGRAGRGTAIAI